MSIVIRDAITPEDIEAVRDLFLEYVNWLGIDLEFQNFQQEVNTLPGDYVAPKRGALFLAELDDDIVGCAALHTCCGGFNDTDVCEIKRAFVRPDARGKGVGRALVRAAMDRARALGYKHMRLDTMPTRMAEAVDLYKKLGFYEIEPYRLNPYEDATFMEAAL